MSRAKLPRLLRRLIHHRSIVISSRDITEPVQLQHQLNQLRHYYNPHWGYHNPSPDLAGARAFTLPFPPWPRRSRAPFTSPSIFFSSLVGREEAEVLDMDAGTVRCAANYAPLTPISFIERAAAVYGDRPAVVYGEARPTTWREARERCVRVAGALAARLGVARGDVVSAQPDKLPPVCRAVVASLNNSVPSPWICLPVSLARFVRLI
jgi:hypothetical protein